MKHDKFAADKHIMDYLKNNSGQYFYGIPQYNKIMAIALMKMKCF
jgi:hypothetical protein